MSDIYAVIAFCLRNRQDVAACLREREVQANPVQQKIESQQGNDVGEVRRPLRANLPQR